MEIIIYWAVKISLWIGLVFCAYSVLCPDMMIKLLLKVFQLKMKWFGFKGSIQPGDNVRRISRIWSLVMVIILGVTLYIFCLIFTIGCVLK